MNVLSATLGKLSRAGILAALVFAFCVGESHAQDGPTVSADTAVGSPGAAVSVPVRVESLESDLGVVQLVVEFDASVLSFKELANAAGGKNFQANVPESGTLKIAFFSTGEPISFSGGGGTLFEMKFAFEGGSSPVAFAEGQSKLEDASGAVLGASFEDGRVAEEAAPTIEKNAGLTLKQGGRKAITTDRLSASDPNNGPSELTYTVTSLPSQGNLLVNGSSLSSGGTFTQQDLKDGNVEYNHTAGSADDDSFTFDLKDPSGKGSTGKTFSITVSAASPPAPTDLSATAGDGQVKLSWSPGGNSSPAGYNVYRSKSSFSDIASATKVNGALVGGTSYTDSGLSNGTEYFYRVTAVGSSGSESAPSDEVSATPRKTALSEGLFARYPFNGNANDASGNGNDGSVKGATLTAGHTGKAKSAYSFDGSSYIKVPKWGRGKSSSRSWAGWVFARDGGGYFQRCNYNAKNGGEWHLEWLDGSNRIQVQTVIQPGNHHPTLKTEKTYAKNKWHFVAAVWDLKNNQVRIFVNGELDSSTDIPDGHIGLGNGGRSTNWKLGGTWNGGSFHGNLDNVRIYDRVLSASEVQKLFEKGDGSAPPAPSDLSATAGDRQVQLNWSAGGNSSPAGYNIYRSKSSFDDLSRATRVNTENLIDGTSFTDTSLTNGTRYFYRVTAVSSSGAESEPSREVGATPEKKTVGDGLADAPWPRDGRTLESIGRSPNAGPKNGAIKWSFQSDESTNLLQNITIGPDGIIYVGSSDEDGNSSDDNNLYAISPDGSEKWVYDANGSGADESGDISRGVAISDDGTLYAGSNSDHLHAIREDGTQKWANRLVTQRAISSSPAIVEDGTIYIGTNAGELVAVKPDGSIKWSFDTGGRTHSPAVASDGTIYVGSGDQNFSPGDPGAVYAINPDGTQKWSYQTGGEVKGDPAVGPDGTVYVGGRNGKVYALNSDGTLKWSFSTNGYVNSDPAVGPNGTVYVGSRDDHLYALNEDGSLKWKFQTGGDINSAPAVGGDGRIYVGSRDSTLYAVNPDGSKAWSAELGQPVGSPAIGADGRLYVTAGRKLYAVGSGTGGDGTPPIAPVADTTQQAGSTFWVDIKVGSSETQVQNLFGVSFTLNYDESHLSVVKDEAGAFLGSDVVYSANNDAGAGEIGIGVSRKSGAGGVDGSGVVARVKFKVAEDAGEGTSLSFDLKEVKAKDPNDNAITLSPKSLEVTVRQGLVVWPGDTNNDGVVDQADVLPIGLHWGTSGSARSSESCTWKEFRVPPWSPEAATYPDANGDGAVDQADVLCIGQNWGKTHPTSSAALASKVKKTGGTVQIRRVEAPGRAVWYELQAKGTGRFTGASAKLAYRPDQATVLKTEPGRAMGSAPLFESRVDEKNGTVALAASRKGTSVSAGKTFARVKVRLGAGASRKGGSGKSVVTVQDASAGLASGGVVRLESATPKAVDKLTLRPPSPNPARSAARVRYALPEAREAHLVLYNALGQKVKTVAAGQRPAGRHEIRIDLSGLASGLYLLRLRAGPATETRKITVVR